MENTTGMPWQRRGRLWRHLVTDDRSVRRAFPERALNAIETAIGSGEMRHRGQVVLAIEAALPLTRVMRRCSPRERAIEVFSQLRVWDTEDNCGVLIYLLLADRDVEIVADRGISARVSAPEWEAVCRQMEGELSARRYKAAALAGIDAVHALMATHYPAGVHGRGNEIPNRPVVL